MLTSTAGTGSPASSSIVPARSKNESRNKIDVRAGFTDGGMRRVKNMVSLGGRDGGVDQQSVPLPAAVRTCGGRGVFHVATRKSQPDIRDPRSAAISDHTGHHVRVRPPRRLSGAAGDEEKGNCNQQREPANPPRWFPPQSVHGRPPAPGTGNFRNAEGETCASRLSRPTPRAF